MFIHVGGRPIDGSVKLFDGGRGHLNPTVAGFATLQGLDVIAVERKAPQVRKLWRIGEHYKRQKAGNLAQAVEIAGKLEVGLGSSMDVDRAKQQNLGRRAGWEGLRHRLSAADGSDLILAQSDVLPKECLKVTIRLGRGGQGGRCEQGQHSGNTHCTSDHGNITPSNYTAWHLAHPFRQSLGDTKDDLAACVAHLTEFVGLPGIRKRQDGFDHGFQFSGIHERSDFG